MTIDQGVNVDMSAERARVVIGRVKGIVEGALRESFGAPYDVLGTTVSNLTTESFRGRLSTDPQRVDSAILSDNFYEMCGTFSAELQRNLTDRGFSTEVSRSTREDWSTHNYLVAEMDGVEVIIDPSIGQYIKGHNHVFVGTREELHDIVVNQTGIGKQYEIWHTRSHNNPQEAFERIWGNTSQPMYPKKS